MATYVVAAIGGRHQPANRIKNQRILDWINLMARRSVQFNEAEIPGETTKFAVLSPRNAMK